MGLTASLSRLARTLHAALDNDLPFYPPPHQTRCDECMLRPDQCCLSPEYKRMFSRVVLEEYRVALDSRCQTVRDLAVDALGCRAAGVHLDIGKHLNTTTMYFRPITAPSGDP
jgi:hypothetical protein